MVIRKIAPTGKWAKANPRQVRNSEQKIKKKKEMQGAVVLGEAFGPLPAKMMWSCGSQEICSFTTIIILFEVHFDSLDTLRTVSLRGNSSERSIAMSLLHGYPFYAIFRVWIHSH